MDATNALGVAPEPVSLQNLHKCRSALFLPEFSGPLRTCPVVIPGAGDTGQFTQLLHCQDITPIRQRGADGLESLPQRCP